MTAISAFLLLLCTHSGFAASSSVISLTQSNFDSMLNNAAPDTLWFLKFYAPWCGHCKRLAPILDKLAPRVQGKMKIAKIDCTKEKDLCKRFNVRGYPTLKYHRSGTENFNEYNGGRTERDISSFSTRMSRHPTRAVTNIAQVHKLSVEVEGGDPVSFVAYDGEAQGFDVDGVIESSHYLTKFKRVARSFQESGNFALFMPKTKEEEIQSLLGVKKDVTTFVAKIELGVPPKIFEGDSYEDILKFVVENNRSIVTELNARSFGAVAKSGKLVVVGVKGKDTSNFQSIRDELVRIALTESAKEESKFAFGWIDGEKYYKFLRQYGVSGKESLFFALNPSEKMAYRDESIDSVEKLLEDILSGTIEGYAATEPTGADKMGDMWGALKSVFDSFKPYSYILFAPVILIIVQIVIGIYEAMKMREDDRRRHTRQKQD